MSLLAEKTVTLHDGRSVVLRHGVPADAPALLSFVDAVLAESEHLLLQPGELKQTVQEEAAWVRMHLDDQGSVLLIAEAAGAIAGMATIARGAHRRLAHRGELATSVRAVWRGVGLGTEMMSVLMAWAEANPLVEKLCLSVFSDNVHAQALYTSFGFVEEGRRTQQLKLGPGKYSDEVLMCRFLKTAKRST